MTPRKNIFSAISNTIPLRTSGTDRLIVDCAVNSVEIGRNFIFAVNAAMPMKEAIVPTRSLLMLSYSRPKTVVNEVQE
jgi:hypothetical protein